jgi:hypothetical protein
MMGVYGWSRGGKLEEMFCSDFMFILYIIRISLMMMRIGILMEWLSQKNMSRIILQLEEYIFLVISTYRDRLI